MKNRQKINTKLSQTVDTLHGILVNDPYRWLELDTPERDEWVAEQNAQTRNFLDRISVRQSIKQQLKALYSVDTVSIPLPRKNRYFFEERLAHDDLPNLYVQDGIDGDRRVLIDANKLARDTQMILHDWYPSPDGTLLAYALSASANDQANIIVREVDSEMHFPDTISDDLYPCAHTALVWHPDSIGFWYSRRQENTPAGEEKLHQKVYFHQLGTDSRDDEMVFGDLIAKEDIPWMDVSHDARYLLIGISKLIGEVSQNAVYLFDRENSGRGFVSLVDDVKANFYVHIHDDRIFILTNHSAEHWKVLSVPLATAQNCEMRDWDEVIAESAHAIESIRTVGDSLFVQTLENVHSVLRRYTLTGELINEIELPDIGTLTGIAGEEFGTEMFFGFTSFVIPHQVYRLDLQSREISLIKEASASIDPTQFVVSQVWYPSKDGTKIPMFLIHATSTILDGNTPTLLYGYGGFNCSLTPTFMKSAIPFIRAGGIYAIANLRGGGEFGEAWYRAGTREKKQTVFDDFIAAAEWLVAEKYTSVDRLAIFGWSNGGLLTATVANQRSDLFKAVVIGAPVIDMLRYHLFGGGCRWIRDYGNPDDPEMFTHLFAYSPYHNVRNGQSYPATLIVTADKDDRVPPFHAYKFAAQLQVANASNEPILLRVQANAGHASAPAVSEQADLYADIWAFVFKQLGL